MKMDKYFRKIIKIVKSTCLILGLFATIFLVGCDLNNDNSNNDEHVDNLFNEIKETIDLDNLESDIYIPDTHRGATITVESSDTSVIDIDGTVNRQEEDELVILSFTIEYQGVTYVRELTIVVKGTGEIIDDSSKQDQEYVDSVYSELISLIDPNNVTSNLILNQMPSDVLLQLRSSNSNVISSNGVVNRLVTDVTVTLTFELEYNNKIYSKELIVVVKGTGIVDGGVTEEDLEQILSKIVLDQGYLSLENSINLPTTIDNYPIVWSVDNNSVKLQGTSSQKQLAPNDALVDTNYILTAEISYGRITASRDFNGVVKAITTEGKLKNIKNDLSDILSLENNTIDEDISFKYTSLYGSTIIWESSDTNVISNDGYVNKDLSSEKSVTIYYTIILDNVEYEGQFKVTVEAKTVYSSYYSAVDGKSGNALFKELRSIITKTHTKMTSYDDCKRADYIKKTDGDPNNSGNIILFWSNVSIKFVWDSGKTWNREHVWPQSKGWFSTSGAGADLHHIRPVDSSINSAHGNDPYAIVSGGTFLKTSSLNGSVLTNCKKGGSKFEPSDDRKGDVARIIFYLLTRYPESDNVKITNVATSIDMLLEWHESDPVDQSEIRRNEAVYSIQGNRNPFIDYEEFADMIW